jgi:hypothetical protein
MFTEFISQGFLPEYLGQHVSQWHARAASCLPPKPKAHLLIFAPPLLPNSPDSFFSLTTSPTQIPANSKDFATLQTSSLDILIAYTHYSTLPQRGAILPAVAENILFPFTKPISQGHPSTSEFMSIENLKTYGESLLPLRNLLPDSGLHLRGSFRLSDIDMPSHPFVPAFVAAKPHVESPLISISHHNKYDFEEHHN